MTQRRQIRHKANWKFRGTQQARAGETGLCVLAGLFMEKQTTKDRIQGEAA